MRLAFATLWLSTFMTMSAASQTLYLDPQFGFSLTSSVVFAQKDIGNPASTVDLRLELYEPSGVGVPIDRPVLIGIHGGGFTSGSRFSSRITDVCEAMAMRGYTCVSLEYRLDGDDPVVGTDFQALETLIGLTDPTLAQAIAAATEDTMAAMQWLLDNQATLDIAPLQLGVFGYSAGGVLTEIVGYLADEGSFPRPIVPQLTFNMSGAFDPAVQIVAASDPALLISHGDLDSVVPLSGAIALDAQAALAGIVHELHVLVGETHGSFDIFTNEVAPGVTVFDRFVALSFTHVAALAVPTLPIAGLVVLGIGILVASRRPALRVRGPG